MSDHPEIPDAATAMTSRIEAIMAAIGHDSDCDIGQVDDETLNEIERVRLLPCSCALEAKARAVDRISMKAAATLADLRGAEFGTEVARCAASIIAEAIRAAIEREEEG